VRTNLIEKKSFRFSILVINLYRYLSEEKKEFILSKQLLKSGTSIGANIKEALEAQSKKDFLSKMNLSLKEARESEYWLELLIEAKYLETEEARHLLTECNEICRILNSIVKTTKENLAN